MQVNETALINNIKKSYEAILKYGEIGPDGFDYIEQLKFNINLYETLLNKSFDMKLLGTL